MFLLPSPPVSITRCQVKQVISSFNTLSFWSQQRWVRFAQHADHKLWLPVPPAGHGVSSVVFHPQVPGDSHRTWTQPCGLFDVPLQAFLFYTWKGIFAKLDTNFDYLFETDFEIQVLTCFSSDYNYVNLILTYIYIYSRYFLLFIFNGDE